MKMQVEKQRVEETNKHYLNVHKTFRWDVVLSIPRVCDAKLFRKF